MDSRYDDPWINKSHSRNTIVYRLREEYHRVPYVMAHVSRFSKIVKQCYCRRKSIYNMESSTEQRYWHVEKAGTLDSLLGSVVGSPDDYWGRSLVIHV